MAADAELRLGELGVRHHAIVDVHAPPVFAGFDEVFILVGDNVVDDALFAGAVDRLVDLARLDPALAVDLVVLLLDAVAGDAAHALAGDLAARPKRRCAILAELGADLLVAAHAEGADRTLGQLRELLLERVEHRRDRRIGVIRRRPLLVNLLMAFAALRGGGIEGERLLVDAAGIGEALPFAAFAAAARTDTSPSAVRFRVRGQLLLAADHVGLAVRGIGCASSLGSSLLVLLDKSFERGVRIDCSGGPLFWANLKLGCACTVWVCTTSLDAATAFWPTNAA